ncbi:MAG: hypothetical protein AAB383_04340 [Patescibacteria group bacterium]
MQDEEIMNETETVPVLPETPETREQLDALETEVVGKHIDEMEDAELMENIEAVNDETLAFLKEKSADENREIAERAKFQYEVYGATLVLMQKVHDLISQKEFEQAEALVMEFLDQQILRMQGMGMESLYIENAIREIQDFVNIYGQMVEQVELKEPTAKMQLLSTGLDILPFVGGTKMMAEGTLGKNLVGEELSAKKRILYVAEGGMWLTVDAVALGAGAVTAPAGGSGGILVEGAAMALKAPKAAKLLTRSAAVVRAAKGAGKGSRALYNVGRFFVEHPNLAKQADKIVARGVEARKAGLLAAPGQISELREAQRNSAEILQAVNTERQELVEALGATFDLKSAASQNPASPQ